MLGIQPEELAAILVAENWEWDDTVEDRPGPDWFSRDECNEIGALVRARRKTNPPPPPDLRTMPYDQYLQTERWKSLREDVRARDRSCVLCNSTERLEVHHRTYKYRGAVHTPGHECDKTDLGYRMELDYSLCLLCARCHSAFHKGKTT